MQIPPGEMVKGSGYFASRHRPLHTNGVDLQREPVVSAAEDMENVANRGTTRRGHDGDALREHRDRFLPRGVEEALFGQPFLELLESELQRSEASRLGRNRVELKLTLLLVDHQSPAHDELEAILDSEAEESRARGEKHDPERRPGVLDREVVVTCR